MIGKTISHYRIVEKLGEGGMGVVYKADDTKLRRAVALKFLTPDKTRDLEAKKRFIHEARAASALDHRNIAVVHEIDETEDGSSFICMAYYPGQTLKERIEAGPLPIDQAIDFTLQIASGLQGAHEAGIVHRDIKPANVIITERGEVKIVDFGIAKLAGQTKSTESGPRGGTAAYMSPEQALGGEVDRRSDLFSLGIVLYEMVTGKRPFQGEHESALLYSIANVDPSPPSTLRTDISPEFEHIILKLLQKDPLARYQTTGELLADLQQIIVGLPLTTFRIPVLARRIAIALPGIALAGLLAWYLISHIVGAPAMGLTLAILQFRDDTNDSLAAGWPARIQFYLSTQLTGAKNISVMYYDYSHDLVQSAFGSSGPPGVSELSALLRDDVNYLITGSIYKQAQRFGIAAALVETKKGTTLQPFETDFAEADKLGAAAGNLSEQIYAYLNTKVLQYEDSDLVIWKARPPKNWNAVVKFSEANDFIFNGQEKDALLRLAQAVDLDSNFLSPRIWMIPGLRSQNKVEDVKRHYEFLLRKKLSANSFESAMIDWVGAFLAKDYAQQAHFLRVALFSSKDNRILLSNLADAEALLGNYSDAVKTLQPCLQTKWKYAPMYRTAGESLLKMRDVDAAKKLLIEALSNVRVDSRVYPMMAAVYKKEGDGLNAARQEQSALKAYKEKNRPFGTAYELMAGYLTDIGMLDSAKAAILRALDEDANVVSYHGQFAEILFKQGDLEQSQTESDVALKLDSSYSKGHFILGEIFEKKGDRSGAMNHYIQFLKLDSTSQVAQLTRQRLKALKR